VLLPTKLPRYGNPNPPLQESGHRSKRVLWRYRNVHGYMIGHQVAFDNFTLLLPHQSMKDLTQIEPAFPNKALRLYLGINTTWEFTIRLGMEKNLIPLITLCHNIVLSPLLFSLSQGVCYASTAKPFQVALVKPAVYLN
jgi:hypothetical protein